jgi:uncharacterized coiled-coil protein SlyX
MTELNIEQRLTGLEIKLNSTQDQMAQLTEQVQEVKNYLEVFHDGMTKKLELLENLLMMNKNFKH